MDAARRLIVLVLFVLATAVGCVGAPEPLSKDRRVLAADYSTKRIAIVDGRGDVEWEHPIDDIHDLHYLPDGHVLFQTSMTHLLEVDPATNKTIWEYDAQTSNGNAGKKLQVHSFQRLPDGNTMIAESGVGRIIEVDR